MLLIRCLFKDRLKILTIIIKDQQREKVIDTKTILATHVIMFHLADLSTGLLQATFDS